MKSNEEFIAGIYEKAAVYKEEKQENIIKVNSSYRAMKMVAMLAVCVGLVSLANIVLHQENKQTEEYGISLLSEKEEQIGEVGVAFHRSGPAQEFATFSSK